MAGLSTDPILEGDLPAVGEFLHRNLNGRIEAQEWARSVHHPWCNSRPNFGVQLRDGERIVGVFLAIYSERLVAGKPERFCNPHSWCVLSEYRRQGIGLVLRLIRQPGYHFSMLTPNSKVAEIFRGLGFKDLRAEMVLFANWPSFRALAPGAVIASDPGAIAVRLPAPVRRDYELHRGISWLEFVVFGRGDDLCLTVYKRALWKRLPCARLIHVSDAGAFERHVALLRHFLLLRKRLLVSQVELRFIGHAPRLAIHRVRTQAKLFLSPSLDDGQVLDLYSELAALDI